MCVCVCVCVCGVSESMCVGVGVGVGVSYVYVCACEMCIHAYNVIYTNVQYLYNNMSCVLCIYYVYIGQDDREFVFCCPGPLIMVL